MFPALTANGLPKDTPHGRLLRPFSMSGRNKANWDASCLHPLHTCKNQWCHAINLFYSLSGYAVAVAIVGNKWQLQYQQMDSEKGGETVALEVRRKQSVHGQQA